MPDQKVFCKSSLTPKLSTCTGFNFSLQAATFAFKILSKSKSGTSCSAFLHAWASEMKLSPTRTLTSVVAVEVPLEYVPLEAPSGQNRIQAPAESELGPEFALFTPSGTTLTIGATFARLFFQTPASLIFAPVKSMQKKL